MGKQVSIINFTGKVGNVIGYKGLDGKVLLSPYDKNYVDAHTSDQVFQRAKLALAAKVAGMLGTLGGQVLVANGLRANRRGALVRSIMNYIQDEVSGPTLGTTLPLVRNPKGSVSFSERRITVTVPTTEASGSVLYKCSGTPDRGTALRYVSAMLIYNPTLDEWRSTCEVADRVPDVRIYIPIEYVGHEVTCYCYTMAILNDPSAIGSTATMGNLSGNTAEFSLPVDDSGVAYGKNLAFTQIDAFVLNQRIQGL